jgi:hypothetical protein
LSGRNENITIGEGGYDLKEIMFDTSKVTGSAMGRNGMSYCIVMKINDYKHIVTIFPFNSKGNATNCFIDIPRGHLQEVIEELTRIAKETVT